MRSSCLQFRIPGAMALALALLGACASGGPGRTADANPPQLTRQSDGKLAWDRPGAFGPVPADRASAGQALCSSLGKTMYAAGFHPAARGENGVSFPDGAYLCAARN